LPRIIPSHLLSLLVLVSLSACKKDSPNAVPEGEPEVKVLRYLTGTPGTVTLPELAEDLGYLAPIKLEYVGSTFSGPQDIQSVVSGSTDFGTAFTGSVIRLAAAGAPVQAVIASAGIDSLQWNGYYALDENPVRSPRDLLGKKVAMNTVGAHHEFMVKEWLRRGNLTPDKIKHITLVSLPPINGEQALRSGQVDLSSLGGILRDKAVERGGIHPLFTDYQLYGAANTSVYVLRKDFIKKNPIASRRFVEAVARAVQWTKAQPVSAVQERFKAIIAKRGRRETTDLVRYWKSNGVQSLGGLLTERDFQLWIDGLVLQGDLEKGKANAKELYTNEFNPYWDSPSR
jgi:ABC-type nitrate/sulfonate/bicarbonate transport system substrate-binding protein